MTEHTLAPATFSQIVSADEPKAERLPVGITLPTLLLFSGVFWVGIYFAIRFMFGA